MGDIRSKAPIDEKEISLAQLLVERLISKDFNISDYNDDYTEKLQRLIDARAKGRTQLIKRVTKEPKQTQDLIAALKTSSERPSSPKIQKEKINLFINYS